MVVRTRVPQWNISLYIRKPVCLICKCPTVKPPAASAQTWESHYYYYNNYYHYYQKSSFVFYEQQTQWNPDELKHFSCFMFQQRTRSDSVDSVWSNRTIVFFSERVKPWTRRDLQKSCWRQSLLHILLLIFLWKSRIPLFLHN